MAYRILTTSSSFGKVDPKPLEMLKEAGFEVVLNPHGRKLTIEESKELMPGFDGMIAGTEKLNHEVLSAAPSVKYLCRLGAGMDSVDFDAADALQVKVENTPSAHIDGVAELTLGGILSSLRSIATAHANMTTGLWKKPMGSLLARKIIGIIGLGQVGKRLVELTAPFKVKVLAYDLSPDKAFAEANNIDLVSLDDMAAQADIITLHVPFMKESKGLINADFLSKAKPNLMMVNASRGGLIDEEALFSFLNENQKASAYLDTFESEPYNGPLCSLDNCTLTPHIGSYASEVRVNMETEAAQNVINHFSK
ncbi:MAG: phosphoglycerate dehydrogenase [Roseivirga sp.]|nr:phosphoglycerate dehydrogenase [Roseivirga sp.]